VCTDRYDGFINAVEEGLPQAMIVADRFHVTKLYRAAVDALRKTELKALKGALTKEQYAGLKGVLWALRAGSSMTICSRRRVRLGHTG
jgi:transposase